MTCNKYLLVTLNNLPNPKLFRIHSSGFDSNCKSVHVYIRAQARGVARASRHTSIPTKQIEMYLAFGDSLAHVFRIAGVRFVLFSAWGGRVLAWYSVFVEFYGDVQDIHQRNDAIIC